MIHVHPTRAFFRPHEQVQLRFQTDLRRQFSLQVTIFHLDRCVATFDATIIGEGIIECGSFDAAKHGYLIQLEVNNEHIFTAFDVLDNWTQAPRYGYVFDFSSGRSHDDMTDTLDYLLGLHVNGLQFYDWQYRHDTLIPPQDEFVDPLGRHLSLATVRALIEEAHQRGMAAMPYTAIYAASPDFASSHPDWALYDGVGQVVDFAGGFLKLMNMDSEWRGHFVTECQRVLSHLAFDGIHVDQYGEPRVGADVNGQPVDIADGFFQTLAVLREAIPTDKTLLFNLVHNWPVEAMAQSPLDFWYSELWPPVTGIAQLWETIRDNQRLNARPAVLAVYIRPDWEATVLAAQCAILASGGTHIAHGDHATYLSDPYFPKAVKPSEHLAVQLGQLADFAVAYANALVFAQDVTEEWVERITINGQRWLPGQVIVKKATGELFINVLPVQGHWNEVLVTPTADRAKVLEIDGKPVSGWCASPAHPMPVRLVDHLLPQFQYWLLVCVDMKDF